MNSYLLNYGTIGTVLVLANTKQTSQTQGSFT